MDKNTTTLGILSKYIKCTEELIDQFYRIYINENYEDRIYKDDWYIIWWYRHWAWVIEIGDFFFQIEDVFLVFNEWIEEKILFDWYYENLDHHTKNKEWNFMNLYTYNKIYGKSTKPSNRN